MGLIKEPKGVDLVVGPSVLTKKDKVLISAVIANYKRTGKLPSKSTLPRISGTRKGKKTYEPHQ
jgi:hypothetical protein